MLSQEDCMAMCGLERREIAAIAEHEHLPEIQAAALASCLLRDPDGVKIIRQIIADDITNAIECNRLTHADDLFRTLREFIGRHPDAADDLILD
jgi:hypothetical protein